MPGTALGPTAVLGLSCSNRAGIVVLSSFLFVLSCHEQFVTKQDKWV